MRGRPTWQRRHVGIRRVAEAALDALARRAVAAGTAAEARGASAAAMLGALPPGTAVQLADVTVVPQLRSPSNGAACQ